MEDKDQALDTMRSYSTQQQNDLTPPRLMSDSVNIELTEANILQNRLLSLANSSSFHHKETIIMSTIAEVSVF